MMFRHPHIHPSMSVALILMVSLILSPIALAQETRTETSRVALVVGNSDYRSGPLRPAARDARAIGEALRALGFKTTVATNLDQRKLKQHIDTYLAQLSADHVGLFYFSGYLSQVNDQNYLIPVDAHILTKPDVTLQSVSLQYLLSDTTTQQTPRRQIIILDASRDNPFEQRFRDALGVAFVNVPNQMVLALSDSPGNIYTSDADMGSSVYTSTLIKLLRHSPELTISDFLRQARAEVRQQTHGEQVPWESSRFDRRFCFSCDAKTTPTSRDDTTMVSAPERASSLKEITRNFNGQPLSNDRDWVLIEPGTYKRGTKDKTQKTISHKVTISRPFLIQRTETTQQLWNAVMDSNPSQFHHCDDCPVERISLYDALIFANALSVREGLQQCYQMNLCRGTPGGGCAGIRTSGCSGDFFCKNVVFSGLDCTGYRLPTEAEWEFAARAGSRPQTVDELDAFAWSKENSSGATHPVSSKLPNAWGLHDMLGNVWEWVWGWHSKYPSRHVTDPLGTASSSMHINRGGSWRNNKTHVNPFIRHAFNGMDRYNSFGVRLVRTAPRRQP